MDGNKSATRGTIGGDRRSELSCPFRRLEVLSLERPMPARRIGGSRQATCELGRCDVVVVEKMDDLRDVGTTRLMPLGSLVEKPVLHAIIMFSIYIISTGKERGGK